jgi:precorrin-6B methylase 2
MVFATPAQYLPWGYFIQGIKTGVPQATEALRSDIFDYYAHHPEEVAIFQKTMQASTAGVTAEIVRRLDTSKSLMAVDVGGATGSLIHSLMQINPKLQGIVYDRPENVPGAQTAATSLGLSERSTAVAGDFFESVPAGDLYLLRFILHDWNDEDCIRILKNCRRAMMPGSRLVVIESFLGFVRFKSANLAGNRFATLFLDSDFP